MTELVDGGGVHFIWTHVFGGVRIESNPRLEICEIRELGTRYVVCFTKKLWRGVHHCQGAHRRRLLIKGHIEHGTPEGERLPERGSNFWVCRVEADAEILYGKPNARGVRSVELAHPRVFPVASPAWVATHRHVRAPADLVGLPLIHEESTDQWRAWLMAAGVDPPETLSGPRLWHAPLAIEAAARGQGIAIANELIVHEELIAGELVEVMRTNVRLEPYVFATRADRWSQPPIARLRSWLARNLAADCKPATFPFPSPHAKRGGEG